MNNELRRELLLHGLRWATNILVEVLTCHAQAISLTGRNKLAEAVTKLTEAEQEFSKK
jgi:hypothetical protein